MNHNIGILGLIESVTALSIGIVLLAITFKIMEVVGKKYYGIHSFNTSYSVFTAAMIISVGLMIAEIIQPLMSSFRLLNDQGTMAMVWKYMSTGLLYISIAYIAAILMGLISTYLYSLLTPIDEFEEIRKDNLGVAIIVSAILITLTLLTKGGISMIIEAMIPYPELPPR